MASDRYRLDDAGVPQPVEDLLEWGRWMQTSGEACLVARTVIGPVGGSIGVGGEARPAAGMLALLDDILDLHDQISRVMHEVIETGLVVVSTRFLGLDQRLLPGMDGGDPVLWETRVFNGSQHGECRRYCSRAAAVAGHHAVAADVRRALDAQGN
jgi:hypothetical protein